MIPGLTPQEEQAIIARGLPLVKAKDSYPALHHKATNGPTRTRPTNNRVADECDRALKELDRLRRWKAEATEVLKQWDAVSERFDLSGHLGEYTAQAVLEEIKQLQAQQ